MQEAEMERVDLKVGRMCTWISSWNSSQSSAIGKHPHDFGDTGTWWRGNDSDSDGWQLVFVLLVKTEFLKNVQRECETCLGLKLKQLQRRQRECSTQIVGCLNTTHSHTTASKKLNNPVKVMFTLLQNSLTGYRGCVHELMSMCKCGVHISPSPITANSGTD